MAMFHNTIRIEPMAEEHIPAFRECLDAVAQERRYLALTSAPAPESVREFIRSAIARGVPQFVALDGQSVVGWCDVFPNEKEGFTHTGRLGMGVLREYRGQGIGRQLAMKAIERSKEIGLERIELDVYASNKPAIALYESLGFALEGVKKKGRKVDGLYDDVIQMALLV
ncbi:MAG TPA: GNAT family N-acetyltransferase [Haliangiales bacterium]|nr:GNAT family N-acetyltransferase [Haliangiales bacterium]